jgi:hypothetical protein
MQVYLHVLVRGCHANIPAAGVQLRTPLRPPASGWPAPYLVRNNGVIRKPRVQWRTSPALRLLGNKFADVRGALDLNTRIEGSGAFVPGPTDRHTDTHILKEFVAIPYRNERKRIEVER